MSIGKPLAAPCPMNRTQTDFVFVAPRFLGLDLQVGIRLYPASELPADPRRGFQRAREVAHQ
jgi:hypothetical protein